MMAFDASTKLLSTGTVSTGMDNPSNAPVVPMLISFQYIDRRTYVTSHQGQFDPLTSAGREMSTGQSVVMLCGWQ